MPFVVTGKCIQCRYGDCVSVCPVSCFYIGENMMVINPDECIDCGVCEPECPAEAIKSDEELTPDEMKWAEINEKYSAIWPNRTTKPDSLPDADHWSEVPAEQKKMSDAPGEGD